MATHTDIPVPAPSRWDELPSCSGPCDQGRKACTCHNQWPMCGGACEVCPDEPAGPAWFQFTERHPLLIAIAATAIGACPFIWG